MARDVPARVDLLRQSAERVEHRSYIQRKMEARAIAEELGQKPAPPAKISPNARTIAQAIVNDPIYRENLLLRVRVGDAPQMEQLLWHYAYGKPRESVEFHGTIGVEKIIREIIDVPREEEK